MTYERAVEVLYEYAMGFPGTYDDSHEAIKVIREHHPSFWIPGQPWPPEFTAGGLRAAREARSAESETAIGGSPSNRNVRNLKEESE